MKTLLLTLLLVPMMSFGQNNYSMSFDGVDDYVGLTPIDLSNSNEITLMSWFNIQDLQGNESSTIIRQEAGEPNFLLQFENFGNNIEFNIEDDTGTNFSFSISISPSSLEGDWHNISATYDGNYQKIYIDGLLVGDNLISGGNIAYGNGGNPIFLSLGAMYSSSGNINEVTNGSLDDIQVWGTSLTQSEIQQYMNCPPTGTESGLVGYWNFEEGSGTTALDLTSNGNDGTINGATYSTDVPLQNCCTTDTSYTDVTVCDTTYLWNDSTYSQSGTYSYDGSVENDYSISCDGVDDNFEFPYISNIKSITFWVNIEEIIDGDYLIDCREDPNNQNQPHIWYGTPGNPSDDVQFINTFRLNNSIDFTGEYNSFPTNNWVFVYLEANQSFNDDVTFLSHYNFSDGGYNSTCGNGLVDNVSFWSIPLDSIQIDNIMNCPPTGTESGLVGYWNFEEGSGTTVYDLTPNGNNGTINGATYNTDAPVQNCTLTNSAGCDSVAVLNLTIESPTSSTIVVEGLDSYTAPSGTVYTTGGVYTDTIQNAAGCDSIITIDLSLNYTGIGELNNTPKQLIKIVDVLGRETPFKPNTPLLYIYNDGTVERKMIIE